MYSILATLPRENSLRLIELEFTLSALNEGIRGFWAQALTELDQLLNREEFLAIHRLTLNSWYGPGLIVDDVVKVMPLAYERGIIHVTITSPALI
jgi:hypothetical protein